MLGFFRRFQKFFFVIITFTIVVSFLFFGTTGSVVDNSKPSEEKIDELVDGSFLTDRRLMGLIAMLNHGMEEGTRSPNLLNDSLVHKRFIMSGLGLILANHYFENFEDELHQRFIRANSFTSYQHPYASHISAEQVWSQFCPEIIEKLGKIKSYKGNFSKEQIPLLFDCYCAQASFPPPVLHQMLSYQEQQSEKIRSDPNLQGAEVTLFGFETVQDWFGPKFVDKVSRFILNASCFAKEQGYGVSSDEARKNLFQNVSSAMEHFQGGQKANLDQVKAVYENQIQRLGLQEEEAVSIWQDVLAFERMMDEVGQGVFFDTLSLDQFKDFSSKGTTVVHYEMPKFLHFTNFIEMLKFQLYKEIVSEGDLLDLPQNLCDPQDLIDDHPELVYKRFDVEITSVTKEEVAARIPLKKTWEWEGDPDHFAQLVSIFSELEEKSYETFEERMCALDELDQAIRFKIDQYARLQLVEAHPEWIEEELVSREASRRTLDVRLKQSESFFSGEHFLALIEGDNPRLNCYSTDKNTYFRIVTIEKHPGWNIVPFDQANEVLEKKLDQTLCNAHESQNDSTPFHETREKFAAQMYKDLIVAIGVDTEDLDDLATHRFDRYLNQIRALAMEDSDALAIEKEKPFSFLTSTKKWTVKIPDLKEGEFSLVENGSFFQLIAQEKVLASKEEILAAKNHLALEAQKELMKTLLEKF